MRVCISYLKSCASAADPLLGVIWRQCYMASVGSAMRIATVGPSLFARSEGLFGCMSVVCLAILVWELCKQLRFESLRRFVSKSLQFTCWDGTSHLTVFCDDEHIMLFVHVMGWLPHTNCCMLSCFLVIWANVFSLQLGMGANGSRVFDEMTMHLRMWALVRDWKQKFLAEQNYSTAFSVICRQLSERKSS